MDIIHLSFYEKIVDTELKTFVKELNIKANMSPTYRLD